MARPSYRGLRKSVIAAACLVLTAGVMTASQAAAGRSPFRVLQMNLCDSGIAECYTGRSVTEAAAVIREDVPDVVTLNEVCQDDVSTLDRTLAGVTRGGPIVSAFTSV